MAFDTVRHKAVMCKLGAMVPRFAKINASVIQRCTGVGPQVKSRQISFIA